jgi:hypothetical protein
MWMSVDVVGWLVVVCVLVHGLVGVCAGLLLMGVDMGGCVLVHEWIWVDVCGLLFLICKT